MAATKSRPWGNIKPPAGSTVNWGDPINKNLIGCWLFNEGGGNRFLDIAATNHGTTAAGNATRTAGFSGHCAKFDGVDDVITVPDADSLDGMDQLTISAVVYATTSGGVGAGRIVEKNSTTSYLLSMNGTTGFQFIVNGITQPSVTLASSLGRWFHVVGVYDGQRIRCFVDGRSDTSNVLTTAVATSAVNLTFGNRPALDRAFDGRIDNIRIYNRGLARNEVLRLYSQPFAGITEPRIRIRSSPAAAPSGNRRRRIICGQG